MFINVGYVVGLLPVTGLQLPLISAGGTSTATTLFMLGIITNAARHEPEAVAALRAGREDRFNRLLRLPLPEPYVPTRLEAARDRLRTRPDKPRAAKPQAAKPKAKPKAKAGHEAQAEGQAPSPSASLPRIAERGTADAADRTARGAGHHGDRQRQPSRRARPLEGQRYG